MIKKNILMLYFASLSLFGKTQIPVLRSNTSNTEKEASVIFKNFSGQYDFIISFTRESYWWGNKRFFWILGHKQDHWEKLFLSEKQKKNSEWSKPVISKEEFNQNNADSIVNFFNQNRFWELNRDSLNINQREIDDKKNQVFSISDAVNYKFEILSKQEFLIIACYAPEHFLEKIPEIKCREVFIRCRDFFISQLKKTNN